MTGCVLSVGISLAAAVPMPYASFPGVTEIIEGILAGVIARLEASLKANLQIDYQAWCRQK